LLNRQSGDIDIASILPTGFLGKLRSDPMLRNPDFRRFWLSSILTNFGAQVTMLALPLCAVLLLHATPAEMGMLAAIQSLPFLLFDLPTGVLLDRKRRLPVMLASDTMVALALASVPLARWLGTLSVPWIYARRLCDRHRLRGRRRRRAGLSDLPRRARQADRRTPSSPRPSRPRACWVRTSPAHWCSCWGRRWPCCATSRHSPSRSPA
jgi:hypothetical protein